MNKRHPLRTLKLFIFHYHAANTIMISFLPLYLKHKGLNGTEIGWVLAIGPFASIISQPYWGYLSDKYKTLKRMILLSVVGMLVMSIVFFQMNALIFLLIFGAFFYFFSSPVGGLSDSLAQRHALNLDIPFGSIRMWGSIGFAFSSLLIGDFLSRTGIEYMLIPYLFFGTIALLIGFRLTDVKTDSTPIQFNDMLQLVKNTPFVVFLIVMMFLTITHRANDSFISLFVTELGGTEGLAGTAWFIALISEAAVFATAGLWFRKFHPIFFTIFAGVIYTVRWIIYGYTTNPYAVIPLQLLHGLSFAVFYVAALDYVSRIIPSFLQSSGHLIFYSVLFGVSGIFGSLSGGVMMEHFGLHTLYMFLATMTTVGVALLIGYAIWIQRRPEEIEQ